VGNVAVTPAMFRKSTQPVVPVYLLAYMGTCTLTITVHASAVGVC